MFSKNSFIKNCPKCNNFQYYKKKWNLENAIKNNTFCNKCSGEKRKKLKLSKYQCVRKCPVCKENIQYIDKFHLSSALKRNNPCKKCSSKANRKYNTLHDDKRKCSTCKKILVYSSRRNLIRAIKINGVCFDCNLKIKRSKSEKFKEKLRNIVINKIKEYGNISYNPSACRFIDELNQKRKWNLQHALNGGEVVLCGYSVDGYDKERNIIFEYDEHYHNREKQKIKDKIDRIN